MFRCVGAARWIGLLGMLILWGACSPRRVEDPLEGLAQEVLITTWGPVRAQWTFVNRTSEWVAIPRVRPDCACLSAKFSRDALPPGASAVLEVGFVPPGRGDFSHLILLSWSSGRSTSLLLKASAARIRGVEASQRRVSLYEWCRAGALRLDVRLDRLPHVQANTAIDLTGDDGKLDLVVHLDEDVCPFEVLDLQILDDGLALAKIQIPAPLGCRQYNEVRLKCPGLGVASIIVDR